MNLPQVTLDFCLLSVPLKNSIILFSYLDGVLFIKVPLYDNFYDEL